MWWVEPCKNYTTVVNQIIIGIRSISDATCLRVELLHSHGHHFLSLPHIHILITIQIGIPQRSIILPIYNPLVKLLFGKTGSRPPFRAPSLRSSLQLTSQDMIKLSSCQHSTVSPSLSTLQMAQCTGAAEISWMHRSPYATSNGRTSHVPNICTESWPCDALPAVSNCFNLRLFTLLTYILKV